MSGIGPEEAVILLVDDSDDDVLLTRLALRRARVPNPLVVVRDIEEAISYLEGTGNYANRAEFPLPALVLLDISLTDGTGFTLLRWVRGHSGLRQLRIVMLTCSNEHTDIDDAYSLGGAPWEAQKNYNDEAAISQLGKIRTPTHLVAGANDSTVDVGEDHLLERALHTRDIPATLLVFPGEGHELDQNPWHGKIKVREELKWLQRYGR